MKKLAFTICTITFLALAVFFFTKNNTINRTVPKTTTTSTEWASNESKESQLDNILDKEIELPKLQETLISKSGEYALDCKTAYYSAMVTGGFLIEKSSVKISEGSEKQVLYVEGKTAKFFGAEYTVIQDDENYLIIVRSYPVSGLTETVTINKEKGVGFDTKTMALGISGGPQSDTYILKCIEI